MKLSVVATLYKSASYIKEFHERVSSIAKNFAGESYEIVLVNDGSPDQSLELAIELTERDLHVTVVDLSRNFGHHKAMMTGLAHAVGAHVYLIDSDLEEEPEWLAPFSDLMNSSGSDVVYGVQAQRKGGLFERITGFIFYRIFRLFTGLPQRNNITTARLMTRRYVDALLMHQEREINIGGLWVVTGFKQTQMTVKKFSTSPTTYSLAHKFDHLVNAITSFSNVPLMFIFYSGLFFALTALIYGAYLVFQHIFSGSLATGYTSLIVSIWFFSGLIICFIGILGIYIAKIFSEVKQRPYTIVRAVYGQSRLANRKE